MGSGISTGNGSLVCGSQAPANKPWRWLEIYLGENEYKFISYNNSIIINNIILFIIFIIRVRVLIENLHVDLETKRIKN